MPAAKLRSSHSASPEPEVIRIVDLDTASYQRGLNLDFVSTLLPFDMAAAGYIMVSSRDGKLYVIDGQHRVAAALRSGESEVMAQVYHGLSEKEEAQLRLKANHRKNELIYERFKARLVAEDSIALGIMKVVENAGGTIRLSSMSGRDHFVALAAAEKLYRFDGTGKRLAQVLSISGEAFGVPNSDNANTNIINGLAYLLQTHKDVDLGRLVERLTEEGVAGMARRTLGFRGVYGGSNWVNWYRAAIEVYNTRLGPTKRLEWKGQRHKLIEKAQQKPKNEETTNGDSDGAN